jgi:hypothetical protein
MWICSTLGVFSITEAPKNPPAYQVRARKREHLEALLSRTRLGLGIVHSPDADYPYRFFVNRTELSDIFAHLADTIGYSNFKSEMHRIYRDGKLDDVLHNVHAELTRLEGPEAHRYPKVRRSNG